MRTLAVSQQPPRRTRRTATVLALLFGLLVTGLVTPTAQAALATPTAISGPATQTVIDPAQAPAPTLAITGPTADEDPAIRHYLGTMPLAWQVPELTGIRYAFTDASGQPDEYAGVHPVGQVQGIDLSGKTATDPNLYVMAGAVFTIDGKAVWGPWSGPVAVFKDGKPVPVSGTTPGPKPECPTLEVIGVRGSKGSMNDGTNTDTTIASFAVNLARAVPGMRFDTIAYPAVPVGYGLKDYAYQYFWSTGKGKGALLNFTQGFVQKCAGTPIVFVGFSQGADVVGSLAFALRDLVAASKNKILLVLIGNPGFNPKLEEDTLGGPKLGLKGILGHIPLVGNALLRKAPSQLHSRILSVCSNTDPICNYRISTAMACANLKQCSHLRYPELGLTSRAADWVIKHLAAA